MSKVRESSGAEATRASFWYTVCNIIQKLVSVIVVPLYTRLMTGAEYGTYSVFQSWLEVVLVFVTLNLHSYVFNNGMLKYKNDRDGFSSAMVGLSGVLGLIWALLFFLIPEFWVDVFGLNAFYLFLLLFRCIVTPWFNIWAARLRYEFRYKPVVASTIAVTIAVPLVSIPAMMNASDRLTAALICQMGVYLGAYSVPLVLMLRRSLRLANLKYWVYALKFNIPLVPHFLSSTILSHSDRIMISWFCGAEQAAMYSVAYSAAQALNFLHSAIVQSLVPWMYEQIRAGSYASVRRVGMMSVALVGVGSIVLCLLGPEVMFVLAPPEYVPAVLVIPPVASSVMLMTCFNLFATVEYYFEETKAVALASIAGAMLNVVLNLVFLPMFGYLVSAWATLACYVAYVAGHYILMRRALRIHMDVGDVFRWRGLFLLVAVLTLAILAAMPLYGFPAVVRYIALALLLVAAIIAGMHWRSAIKGVISPLVSRRKK